MKKELLIIICMSAAIAACSTDRDPVSYRVSDNVVEMHANTMISVNSMTNLSAPENDRSISELGSFKVRDNIYDASGEKIVIPRDSVISGLYTNDGVDCYVSWKSVYANARDFNAHRPSFSIQNITEDSSCMPAAGIKKGSRVAIHFKL